MVGLSVGENQEESHEIHFSIPSFTMEVSMGNSSDLYLAGAYVLPWGVH